MSLKQAVLVVDGEMNHVQGTSLQGIEAMVVTDTESALDAVRDRHLSLRGILIASDHQALYQLINEAFQYRSGVPLLLLGGADSPLSSSDVENLGIRGNLSRQLTYKEILEHIQPLSVGFDNEAAMMVSDLTRVGSQAEGDFIPIRADNFLSGHQSLFDIYVRLSESKYFKICSCGSKFDELRVSNYINKGITHFYLRKDAQKVYLDYCRFLTKKIGETPSVPKEIKVAQTLNLGEVTMNYLAQTGLSAEDLQAAVDYSNTVRELFEQIAPNGPEELKDFVNDLRSYDHGVAVTMLTSLMAAKLGHSTNFGAGVLGIASLLHDIGLMGLSEAVRSENEDNMSLKERAAYRKHPLVGAQILSRIPGISPVAIKAVEHHRVRHNKQGFPAGIDPASISSVAEMIGMAHEFHLLIAHPDGRDALAAMRDEVLKGFSPQMVRVFNATFFTSNS